jgi:hypothetical protein
MAVFCIPRHLVEKLKASALRGAVDIKALYEMSSAERRAFFVKHTDEQVGKFLNTEFEKAMISKQKTAITDWAKSVFSPEAKTKPSYQSVLDKIKSLDALGVLNPKSERAFLQDLVTDKLGVSVSPEEVAAIQERAQKIDAAQIALGEDLGNPEKLDENLAFWTAKKKMDDYLASLVPANRLKVATSTIGRGMMLASIKSPILNIGSNTELAITEALVRRLSGGRVTGADNQLAIDYAKMVNKIYQATGYDISRMQHISDAGLSGSRVVGETVTSQGPGAVRLAGRVVEDIVFKQLMGAPDAAFAGAHFADSVNLNAMKMAKGDKARARTMMLDAMRLEPQTPAGELLREQAILDAQTATWTNDSWASEATLAIRRILNNLVPDLRIGDQLMPFVKTPANVIATGMDYAGLGIPRAAFDIAQAFRNGELGNKANMRRAMQSLVRSGFGLTMAAIIAAYLDDDDFVGAYDPKRKQIEELRNSRENTIRVGGKWIATDWLGPLAVPVTAIMYARKQRGGVAEKAVAFGKGLGYSIGNLPVIEDLIDADKDLADAFEGADALSTAAFNFASDYAYSRLVPSILSDAAYAMDDFERVTTGGSIQRIKAKVPFLREKQPIKRDVFNNELPAEPGLSQILFGSRVKTDRENAVIKEISDVSSAVGKGITFTDWEKSTSKTLAQFKEKHSQSDWENAKMRYGYHLRKMLEEAINKPTYKDLSDEDKLTILNGMDAEAQKKVFSQFKFKYKPSVVKKPKI